MNRLEGFTVDRVEAWVVSGGCERMRRDGRHDMEAAG